MKMEWTVTHEGNMLATQGHLFNSLGYLAAYPPTGMVHFYGKRSGQIILHAHFYRENTCLKNARYSGFGGIEFSGSPQDFDAFLDFLLDWCHTHGVQSLEIKNPSAIYPLQVALQEELLAKKGFVAAVTDTNQHLEVDALDFSAKITSNEKRKLAKARGAGLRFGPLGIERLDEVWEIICDTRLRKNYPMTLEKATLARMLRDFPEHYRLYAISTPEAVVAACIGIKVTDRHLYYFLPGHAPAYQPLSPMVLLLEGLYQVCQAEGMAFLDLGISSVGGILNQGLYTFKQNCGAEATTKCIWRWGEDF
jgi:hypothetical protein